MSMGRFGDPILYTRTEPHWAFSSYMRRVGCGVGYGAGVSARQEK